MSLQPTVISALQLAFNRVSGDTMHTRRLCVPEQPIVLCVVQVIVNINLLNRRAVVYYITSYYYYHTQRPVCVVRLSGYYIIYK